MFLIATEVSYGLSFFSVSSFPLICLAKIKLFWFFLSGYIVKRKTNCTKEQYSIKCGCTSTTFSHVLRKRIKFTLEEQLKKKVQLDYAQTKNQHFVLWKNFTASESPSTPLPNETPKEPYESKKKKKRRIQQLDIETEKPQTIKKKPRPNRKQIEGLNVGFWTHFPFAFLFSLLCFLVSMVPPHRTTGLSSCFITLRTFKNCFLMKI